MIKNRIYHHIMHYMNKNNGYRILNLEKLFYVQISGNVFILIREMQTRINSLVQF